MNLFHNLFNMKSNKKSPEVSRKTEKENKKKSSGWTKVITSLALVWTLSSCGDFPNNEFVVNPGTQTEKFNIEYQFSGWWGGEPTIIDYNILVSKNWEIYQWQIEQKDWWLKESKAVKSSNVDDLFQKISNELESEQITEKTRKAKDDKVIRAKEIFNDSVLNNPNPTDREIRIKYKKK